ncbi:hypothetical protein [Actinoplanes sp. M2I2]|uniref:hypothetical protein n=1 Tax=Actinoplanes sp. M2I2 TaxID=1734444 RepID=UPI00201FFA36|nr:hypothetical protein [Actinoplanes sp. M2I2]
MTYGSAMAGGYDRGRGLRPRDVERWMSGALPYLPAGARALAGLPGHVFEQGLAALRRDAREGRIAGPVVDRLDLVVFRLSALDRGSASTVPRPD